MNIAGLRSIAALAILCLPLAAVASINTCQAHYQPSMAAADTLKIRMTAKDSSSINEKTHIRKLYGAATLTRGLTKITADSIELNENTNMGIARGNVVIYNNNKVILKNPVASFFKLDNQ